MALCDNYFDSTKYYNSFNLFMFLVVLRYL